MGIVMSGALPNTTSRLARAGPLRSAITWSASASHPTGLRCAAWGRRRPSVLVPKNRAGHRIGAVISSSPRNDRRPISAARVDVRLGSPPLLTVTGARSRSRTGVGAPGSITSLNNDCTITTNEGPSDMTADSSEEGLPDYDLHQVPSESSPPAPPSTGPAALLDLGGVADGRDRCRHLHWVRVAAMGDARGGINA